MRAARTGNWLAAGAAVGAGLFVTPFKLARDEGASPLVLAFGLVLFGSVFNTVASWVSRRATAPLDRHSVFVAAALCVFTVVGNWLSSTAVSELHPAILSTVLQTQVLFAPLLGWFVLRERVTLWFVAGVVLAFTGIVLLRQPSPSAPGASLPGIGCAAGAAFCFTCLHVLTRKHVERIEPVHVNALRLWLSAAVLLAVPGVAVEVRQTTPSFWMLVAAAAFCGPFSARVAMMYSTRYISAAQGILISVSSPAVALAFAWAVLGIVPAGQQLAGAVTLLCGVAVPLVHTVVAARRGREI